MTTFFYFYDRFFESNRNFTTEHMKIVKIPGFSKFFNDNKQLVYMLFGVKSKLYYLTC